MSLQLIHTHSDGTHTAKVYRDREHHETRIEIYQGATHLKDQEAFEDTVSAGIATAQTLVRDATALLETAH